MSAEICRLLDRWRKPRRHVDARPISPYPKTYWQGVDEGRQQCARELERVLLAAPAVPAPQEELTFRELMVANLSRVVRWHPGGLHEWSPLEWAGAMAGEAGEACNAAKKLKRIDGHLANINHEEGRSLTDRKAACQQIAKEVADTVIYGSLLVSAVGEDLGAAVIEAFNRKSEEYGFPERLPLAALPAQEEEMFKGHTAVEALAWDRGWKAASRQARENGAPAAPHDARETREEKNDKAFARNEKPAHPPTDPATAWPD